MKSFEIYHINEEMGDSKCQFSHSGSCTRIPHLHILENKHKLHKSTQILFDLQERCAYNRMQKNYNEIIIVLI